MKIKFAAPAQRLPEALKDWQKRAKTPIITINLRVCFEVARTSPREMPPRFQILKNEIFHFFQRPVEPKRLGLGWGCCTPKDAGKSPLQADVKKTQFYLTQRPQERFPQRKKKSKKKSNFDFDRLYLENGSDDPRNAFWIC